MKSRTGFGNFFEKQNHQKEKSEKIFFGKKVRFLSNIRLFYFIFGPFEKGNTGLNRNDQKQRVNFFFYTE